LSLYLQVTGKKYDTGTRTIEYCTNLVWALGYAQTISYIPYGTFLVPVFFRVQVQVSYSTGGGGMCSHRTRQLSSSKIIPVLHENISPWIQYLHFFCPVACRFFTSFLPKPLLFHACVIMHSTSCHRTGRVTHSSTSTHRFHGFGAWFLVGDHIRALGEGGYCIVLYFVLGDAGIMTLSCCSWSRMTNCDRTMELKIIKNDNN